jgi:class 3 adenylate cyclase/pimeloyl-ACP methyl ester carboxylesterase
VNVAFQVVGEGPPDLIWLPSMTHHVELAWESPAHVRLLNRFAAVARLLVFDKRGTGMSDRLGGAETLETRMDDIRMVMDAAGSERAVICGLGESGPLCVLFAATYPDRTSALVLVNSTPRFVRAPDMPWLASRGEWERRVEAIELHWGETAFHEEMLRESNPSIPEEDLPGFIRVFRLSVSPGAAAAYMRANSDVDVRDVLPLIRVPTLVLQRADAGAFASSGGPYLAERIPGARLVEVPGRDLGPMFGDSESLFKELEAFLTTITEEPSPTLEPDRVLATVLFTDIVDATARAAALGDRAWRRLLEEHHEIVRGQIRQFRGREMDTAGDGFFATFDGPARAIRCACGVRERLRELDVQIRAGLHTGECELVDGKASGIAVHTGARVAAQAESGQILVSSTVKDLVAGSGLAFDDRGTYELKGVPGDWHLYSVATST